MKTLLARWIANRLENRARAMRRSLRDYQRHESVNICVLEQRSRGLRLYAAWHRKEKPHSETPDKWPLSKVTNGSFRDDMKAAA